jgi:hypothetical protein
MKRACHKAFPPVESRDTLTITDTVTKPVFVEIKLPADTLTLSDTIYLPTPEKPLNRFIDTLQNEYAVSLCGWEYNRLVHELQRKETVFSDTVYVQLPQETTYITVDRVHEVEVTPRWHKWILIFLLLIIGLLILRR